jgi:hypothetical protein
MEKKDRFFFKVANDDTPVALFRMHQGFLAQEWYEGKWEHSDRLWDLMQKGFVDLDPCSEEAARAFRPEAFEDLKGSN